MHTSGPYVVINVPFPDPECQQLSRSPEGRKVNEHVALQTFYPLDRFGVSDEYYHELTQVLHMCIHIVYMHMYSLYI